MKRSQVKIISRDFWFKIIEMLQQNWALIDKEPEGFVTVYFIHDGSGVFDRMNFDTLELAIRGLRRNGFSRYSEDQESQKFIAPPKAPFYEDTHPNGPIYSSGRYWK